MFRNDGDLLGVWWDLATNVIDAAPGELKGADISEGSGKVSGGMAFHEKRQVQMQRGEKDMQELCKLAERTSVASSVRVRVHDRA